MSGPTKAHAFKGLLAWLLVTFVAAGLGSIASTRAGKFYEQLVRPDWAPPADVFGPVWTVLYLMMAIAAWLVWRRAGGFASARGALVLYLVQLVLNTLWSWLFFAWHMGGPALADLALLWVLIGATTFAFWRVRPWAGVLMLPYWAWVTFAGFLNHATWQLNPQLL